MLGLGIHLGRDIGTERLTWRQLGVVIENLPESSALFRARNPETYRWNLAEQLLAAAVDALVVANWLNSKDGSKNRNRPEPIERPGVSNVKKKTYGETRMDFAEADAWLAGGGMHYETTANDLVL